MKIDDLLKKICNIWNIDKNSIESIVLKRASRSILFLVKKILQVTLNHVSVCAVPDSGQPEEFCELFDIAITFLSWSFQKKQTY